MTRAVFRQTFMPDLSVVRDARGLVADALAQEGFLEESCLVAALLTGELVTNAVLHARTEFEVTVTVDDGLARVSVRDRNTRLPQPTLTSTDGTTGRGLKLVAAMASAWGAAPTADGKVVWFELTMAS